LSLILNIETATKNCSVSVSRDGTVIGIKELNDGNYSHGENLHVFIETVLKEAQASFSEIDAVAVSKGPGSYTGLRIGVSAAKGLCFSLEKPLISIGTLTALATSIKVDMGSYIIPLLDARRMEVYGAVFDHKYTQVVATAAHIIDETSFNDILEKGNVHFLGDGAEKCKEIIKHKNAIFLDGYFPSAKEMAQLSYTKFQQQDFEDVAYFEPFYLKDFLITKPKL